MNSTASTPVAAASTGRHHDRPRRLALLAGWAVAASLAASAVAFSVEASPVSSGRHASPTVTHPPAPHTQSADQGPQGARLRLR